MLNVAAALGGGLLLKQEVSKLGQKIDKNLPRLKRAVGNNVSFRLSVHVVAASIPALSSPGYWSRQRPRLEVALNKVQKETELADFADDDGAKGPNTGASVQDF